MKILTALNNQYIQDSLKINYSDLEFMIADISYQEGVLEALEQCTPDAVIINLGIEGDLDRYAFIESLRKTHEIMKIILIMQSGDKEFNNWLVTRGVYDIFVDGQCTFDDIHQALCREQKVLVKKEIVREYAQKERIVTRDRIVKEYIPVNFKKVILSIWGSTEFACEFAYLAARFSSYRVILIDFNFFYPVTDIYLNLFTRLQAVAREPPHPGFGIGVVLEAMEKENITAETFDKACIRHSDAVNLNILTEPDSTQHYEEYKDKDITGFIQLCYRNFDIVILVLGRSPLDPFSSICLSNSDFYIAAINASADCIKELEAYFLYMYSKYGIPLDRLKVAVWEYVKGVHYPQKYLTGLFTKQAFLGAIPYDRHRVIYRNLNATYVRHLYKRCPSSYIRILSRFNIVSIKAYKRKKYQLFKFLKKYIKRSKTLKKIKSIITHRRHTS